MQTEVHTCAMTDATQTVGSADGAEMRLDWKLLHTNSLFVEENNLVMWRE